MNNTAVNYSAWKFQWRPSGEVGERARWTICCDYSDALIASHTHWSCQ